MEISLRTALVILGFLGIITTALPFLRVDAWWVRIFDFPRLQIAFLLFFTLLGYSIFGWSGETVDYLFCAGMIACLGNQAYMMFPYTELAGKQVQASHADRPDSTVSLLPANVLQTNRNSTKLKEIITAADPDIFLAVEIDEWWQEELQSFAADYPYSVIHDQENTYGMVLYSKLELIDAVVKFLVEDEVPSIHSRVRLRSGDQFELRCLHPPPPFPTEDRRSTERDVEMLIVGKEVRELSSPVIVMGDLNDVAWSRTNYLFQNISGLLDPRIGRGFYHTFHAGYPFMRFPLDHCFHSNHFRLIDFKRLAYFGSDHFPVSITLSHEPEARTEQEKLRADSSEESEAREKISERLAEGGSQITPSRPTQQS